jgi:hypothetical protein
MAFLSDIEYAFQALAIDEKRMTFPPTLWHKTTDGPLKGLQQCWFPGVHSNIGGQQDSSISDHGELGNVTFGWMVRFTAPKQGYMTDWLTWPGGQSLGHAHI